MKCLVTGGAGFIGSHLTNTLVGTGHEVVVVDNLSTGRLENVNSKARFCKLDVTDLEKNPDILEGVNWIFHLAASVGVRVVMQDPLRSLENNINSTEVVLRLAHERNIPVLITSTSEVYGKSKKVPFAEDDDRLYGSIYNYRWGYALSKSIDEFLALAYFREKKLPTVVIRLFNTVGPRQSHEYGMVLPRFVQQCLKNQPITVYGSGQQTRCFCYVEDVIGGFQRVLSADLDKIAGKVFNFGSQEEVTIEQLAKLVKQFTSSSSTLSYVPYAEVYHDGFEDMERRVPDITRARNIIGFEPKHSLDQIIQKVVDYYKKD